MSTSRRKRLSVTVSLIFCILPRFFICFPLSLAFDGVAAYPTIPESDIQEYHRNLARLDQVLGNIEKYIHIAFAALKKEDVVQKMFLMVSYYFAYARIKINVTASA
jgi:hypothetical protein